MCVYYCLLGTLLCSHSFVFVCVLSPGCCWLSLHLLVSLCTVDNKLIHWFIDWLIDTKTPLKKPNLCDGIVSTKPKPKSVYNFLGLLCCMIVWLYDVFVFPPTLRDRPIFHTPMARYSLFVLKVPSNTNFGTKMPVALRYACDPFVFNRLLKAKWMFEGLRRWNLVNTGSAQVWIFIAHQYDAP